MPPAYRTTQEVADLIGVPYSTLVKWQTVDELLRPVLGRGGRRGGDRWPPHEVEIARFVRHLREADMPMRFIKEVTIAARALPKNLLLGSVYLTVDLSTPLPEPLQRITRVLIDNDGQIKDATLDPRQ